jgi:Tol biopolymer transport system component/predicted Ser/Thr protein kinase
MLTPGDRLGPYEIVAPLGAGGMGEVYRARDTRLQREVALKLLPAAVAENPERRARLQREAQLLAALNHPHIAAIYGFEQDALAMELVDGRGLAGPLPWEEARPLALQICAAIEYAHERGIIHRDLKPANIRLTADGQVKLLDFGLAKALEGETSAADLANSPTLTHMASLPGMILGTAAYMAPEQAKGKAVDRRADIWAFGCILFELLSGRQVFHGETATEVLAAVITQEPDWSLLPPSTPASARVLLARCLKKDPRQRLQAIGDARIALEEEAEPGVEPAAGGATGRARWTWIAAAGVAGLILLAAAAWFWRPRVPATPALRFTIAVPPSLNLGYGLALSPDGTRLVFAASGNSKAELWVRRLDELAATPLAGSDDGEFPFWSPDGTAVAFFADGALKRYDFPTGTVRTLCSVAAGGARGGSWSPQGGDGGTIVFSPDVTQPLMKVAAQGGTPVLATGLDTGRQEVSLRWPFFLPDGRHFLLTAESRGPGGAGILAGSLDSTRAQVLVRLQTDDSAAIYSEGHLLYSYNSALVAQPFDATHLQVHGARETVAAGVVPASVAGPTGYLGVAAASSGMLAYRGSDSAPSQLEFVDVSGKLQRTIGPPDAYASPRLSPDGQHIAVSIPNPDLAGVSDLWLIDAASGARSRFTFGNSDSSGPLWSSDGRWIYYTSNTAGEYALYRKLADGSGTAALVGGRGGFSGADSVSRDGRILLYDETVSPATGTDIWWMQLGAGPAATLGASQPFLRTPARELDASPSPDTRWVAYESNSNGNGDWEIFVTDFPRHASQWQISTAGGSWPVWSADGRTIYFISRSNLTAVAVTPGPTPRFSAPRTLFPMRPPESLTEGFADYSPLPGGRGFLINQLTGRDQQSPIVVVTAWH